MPYKKRDDPPDPVRHVLPDHAQDIYKEAFNNSWKIHPGDEQRCHKIAWAAVKKSYTKDIKTVKWLKIK